MSDAAKSSATADDLIRRLQPLYPDVRLSERGLSGEPLAFYVYRDGHFPTKVVHDEWWIDSSAAYVLLSAETGRVVDVNDGWANLMGEPRPGAIGRHFSEFIAPGTRDAAESLFASILDLAEVHTEALLPLRDGTMLALEIHAARDGDFVKVHWRPTEQVD